ncbi:MAG: hypothetical protein ABEI06_07265 [Halobacteriaceae archaeon]
MVCSDNCPTIQSGCRTGGGESKSGLVDSIIEPVKGHLLLTTDSRMQMCVEGLLAIGGFLAVALTDE